MTMMPEFRHTVSENRDGNGTVEFKRRNLTYPSSSVERQWLREPASMADGEPLLLSHMD